MKEPGQSRWSRRVSGAVLFALVLLVGPDGQAAPPATAGLIQFKVALGPADVFADRNLPDAPLTVVQPGEVITLTITGIPKEQYNTYPINTRTKFQLDLGISSLKYVPNPELKPIYPVVESEPEFEADRELNQVLLEHKKPFVWAQDILVSPEAKLGTTRALRFSIDLQVCKTNGTCTKGQHDFEIPLRIDRPLPPEASRITSVLGALAGRNPLFALVELQPGTPPALIPPPPPVEIPADRFKPTVPRVVSIPEALARAAGIPTENPQAPPEKKEKTASTTTTTQTRDDGLLAFLVAAVGFGFISLLTPCVFPMIPITVSVFLHRAALKPEAGQAGSHHSALLLALVYSGTIVLVLTLSGVLFIPLIAPFSQHWITNLVLGTLFVIFALSLFGMFEITLPTWLSDMTERGKGQGGLIGIFFMALTFTIISFTCVAPFYGGFITLTVSATSVSAWVKIVLGALVYSVTFASPFFVLALFPSWLKSLPKSGAWMNTLKVVMGFLELAAAFSFLRSSELALFGATTLFTYDLVLTVYVVLSVLCGLYLLNFFHLPHDHGKAENIGVLQLMFSIAFISLGLYLTPALFTKDPDDLRKRGVVFAWVDAFLLPVDRESKPVAGPGTSRAVAEETWTGDLEKALQQAREKNERVFVDFTGVTCKNCALNERNVFPRPEIRELFRKYVLVKLYTDTIPPDYKSAERTPTQNTELRDQFGSTQLPYYVVLQPTKDDFEKVASYDQEGAVTPEKFAAFLRDNVGVAR